jgi:integration host factor subunit alpha
MNGTKDRIAEVVSGELGFLKNRSLEIVETLIEIIKRTLESGDDVLFSGFGRFCVRQKRERKGRNPATGEDLMLKPRRVVTFKWSRKLRQRING